MGPGRGPSRTSAGPLRPSSGSCGPRALGRSGSRSPPPARARRRFGFRRNCLVFKRLFRQKFTQMCPVLVSKRPPFVCPLVGLIPLRPCLAGRRRRDEGMGTVGPGPAAKLRRLFAGFPPKFCHFAAQVHFGRVRGPWARATAQATAGVVRGAVPGIAVAERTVALRSASSRTGMRSSGTSGPCASRVPPAGRAGTPFAPPPPQRRVLCPPLPHPLELGECRWR